MKTVIIIAIAILCACPSTARSEDLDSPDPEEVTPSKAYQYDHEYFSIRFGGGFLFDYNGFDQNADSQAQLPKLHNEIGIRDLRGLVSGRTPFKPLTYTMGYAYIADNNEWRFRQTGFRVAIPELNGSMFLGRTKEGFSTNKYMVGYYGWFNERSAANDAFIPILADGARWTGTAASNQIVYNVGGFIDAISEKESFNKNDWQFVGRVVWLPIGTDPEAGLLHVALEGREAGANDGQLQFKSKPESFLAQQNVVDTGKFDASSSTMAGVEAYYEAGPFASGLEYYGNWVSSGPANDPFFHGGELFASYLFTGETHPYKAQSGVFEDVIPKKTFFEGGYGAWELGLRVSYVDLTSGPIDGGTFTKFTALVNWYMNAALRLEAAYGYGILDKDDNTGGMSLFQTRVQLQFK